MPRRDVLDEILPIADLHGTHAIGHLRHRQYLS